MTVVYEYFALHPPMGKRENTSKKKKGGGEKKEVRDKGFMPRLPSTTANRKEGNSAFSPAGQKKEKKKGRANSEPIALTW